jgi:hypothetical protein
MISSIEAHIIAKKVEAHIIAQKESYSQIKFELDAKKEKKFRSSYKVSPNEEILAYLLKTVPLGLIVTDGIIVTEKALYINPKHCKDKSTNRIPLTDLCQYILSHSGDREPVFLFKAVDNRYEIFGKTILDAQAGNEIAHFLKDIQHTILESDPTSIELRNQTVQNFFAQCRPLLRYSGLSGDLLDALKGLTYESAYCVDAVNLIAEYLARIPEGYRIYMQALPDCIPQKVREELPSMQERFITDFIADLEDISADFSGSYLDTIFYNIKAETEMNDTMLLCFGLLAVRTAHFSELDGILKQIKGQEKFDRLQYFRGIYSNQAMQRVIDSIQNGKKLNQALLNLTDGIGLTPLHYALILKQDVAVQKLLSLGTWKSPFIEDSTKLSSAYDYVNLAQFKQSEASYEILCAVSDLMRSYSEDKKAIEQKIARWGTLLKGQEFFQTAFEKVAQSNDRNAENYGKAAGVLSMTMDGTGEWINELNMDLQYLDEEMQSCAEKLFAAAQDTVNRWQCSDYPLVAYLVRLYSDPEFLYSELHRPPNDFELYHYGNHYFIAPKDAGITSKDANELDGNAQDTFDPAEKPYGDSWFSPEAHSDINILRVEYHNLAKIYHPDVSSFTYSTQVFQEILQEHTDIIRKLESQR